MSDPNVVQPIRREPNALREQNENPKAEESGFVPSPIQKNESQESYDARINRERKDWEIRRARLDGETDDQFKKRVEANKYLDRKVGESGEDYDRRLHDYTEKKKLENIQAGLDASKKELDGRKTPAATKPSEANKTSQPAAHDSDVRYSKDAHGQYFIDADGKYSRTREGNYLLA